MLVSEWHARVCARACACVCVRVCWGAFVRARVCVCIGARSCLCGCARARSCLHVALGVAAAVDKELANCAWACAAADKQRPPLFCHFLQDLSCNSSITSNTQLWQFYNFIQKMSICAGEAQREHGLPCNLTRTKLNVPQRSLGSIAHTLAFRKRAERNEVFDQGVGKLPPDCAAKAVTKASPNFSLAAAVDYCGNGWLLLLTLYRRQTKGPLTRPTTLSQKTRPDPMHQ